MTRRPIEPLRAHAARGLLERLDAKDVRDHIAVVGDPLLDCLMIVLRARTRDLLRDDDHNSTLRRVALRFLRALNSAARAA